jgi:hypothetical protein
MHKIKLPKYKKQFRLYDIYRYAATGEESHVEGIHSYEVNRDATVMTVRYGEYAISQIYFAKNESELKEIVKTINKRLGNCLTPGKKKVVRV